LLLTTLCYIEKNGQYLMLHRTKKQSDVNKDKWIGIGGKMEENESPEDCLIREVMEETGLLLTDYRMRGVITFIASGWEPEIIFLFTADGFTGELTGCSEGELRWVDIPLVQQLNIWKGDQYFLDILKKNGPFFSLKLMYEGDNLSGACLDGRTIL